MYKETIIIAGLGSELCNMDQKSMVIMHLNDLYIEDLPTNNSEKLLQIIQDISHNKQKQIAISEKEQNHFRKYIQEHYWDNNFKIGLIYLEDQETSWRTIEANRNNLPMTITKPKYPQGWEWVEHIPDEDMGWFTDIMAQVADNTNVYMAYEEGGRLSLARFMDEDQGNNPLSGIEHNTLYQLAKFHNVKSEQEDMDNIEKYAKDIRNIFDYYINEVLK